MAQSIFFNGVRIYQPGYSGWVAPPGYMPTRNLLELLLKLNIIKQHQYINYMQRRFPS